MKRHLFRPALIAASLMLAVGLLAPPPAAGAQRPGLRAKAEARATPTPSKARRKSTKARAAATPRPTPKPTPPPARPDRSLFQSAEKSEAALRASPRARGRRAEWDKVALAYLAVVDRYPRSPYCDDALLRAGNLQREMARRFKNASDAEAALGSYALLVEEYPGSRLGEQALYAAFEILKGRDQTVGAREAAEKYIAAYPDGRRVPLLRKYLGATTPPRGGGAGRGARNASPGSTRDARATPARATASGQVQVFGVRFWSGADSTRVVIDLDRKVEIQQDRLQSPPRLFVDLIGTRLHPNLVGKTFPVGNAFLKQIRIGVNRENVVRVVVDFGEASSHNVFFLSDPERMVIDVRGEGSKTTRAAEARPTVTPAPAAEVMENVQVTQPTPVLPEGLEPSGDATPTPTPRPQPRADATPGATPSPAVAAPPAQPTPRPVATPATATGAAPARNRDGSYSLARQLGLGARRICLDAGHGGHDPGAIGRGGTQEKDVTLAIVLKLEKLLRTELGADVVMTRDTDVFIPLEERTAIANASGADLFLSVHINSARNSAGRGLETYYLSFAKNAAAEELAARENAISQATMKDLNNLVKAITTNSKIDESRDFAGIIQRNNVEGLAPSFKGVLDRGVHTAPFYVLIGANMPSILTEVGFISNPEEEKWLRSDEYQQKLAESLLEGVRTYLGQLNRTQATGLGGRQGARVAARGRLKR